MLNSETIFAIATPVGISGVAVVRISGSKAIDAIKLLSKKPAPKPREMAFRKLYSDTNEIIDEALLVYFASPNSFTGEDVVEFHIHGSRAGIKRLLEVLGKIDGLRPALAGEFTRRALSNNKLDLLQAEALGDMLEAETVAQHRQALKQFAGNQSGIIDDLREKAIDVLAVIEAALDFPDEDLPTNLFKNSEAEVAELIKIISNALADQRAERLRSGITAVIVGAPNAGKSSLLNLLAKRDAAIVTSIAGTTRDPIEVHMEIAGYPLTLIDTAGLRESLDVIENEGIKRTKDKATNADIILAVFDATRKQDTETLTLTKDRNHIIVLNKIDLLNENIKPPSQNEMALSTATGDGVDMFISALTAKLEVLAGEVENPLITQARHRQELQTCFSHLNNFMDMHEYLPEIRAEELRLAAKNLGRMTGIVDVDDILDRVFSRFCIGK
jgi:tRNA modification GTPase